jgi:hypothetical protein
MMEESERSGGGKGYGAGRGGIKNANDVNS